MTVKGLGASFDCSAHANLIFSQGYDFIGRYYTNLKEDTLSRKTFKSKRSDNTVRGRIEDCYDLGTLYDTPDYFCYKQGSADASYARSYA
jgi:hypothetical protein